MYAPFQTCNICTQFTSPGALQQRALAGRPYVQDRFLMRPALVVGSLDTARSLMAREGDDVEIGWPPSVRESMLMQCCGRCCAPCATPFTALHASRHWYPSLTSPIPFVNVRYYVIRPFCAGMLAGQHNVFLIKDREQHAALRRLLNPAFRQASDDVTARGGIQ